MSRKWVDNNEYFGPDRRRRGGMRLLDRRRDDGTADLPPLGALLRRVRVQAASTMAEDRRRALQLLAGAVGEAQRLGYDQCCEALRLAELALQQARSNNDVAVAETRIVEAMNHAAARR